MSEDAASGTNRRTHGGLAALACLLALVALLLSAWCAWQVWQWNAARSSLAAESAALDARLGAAQREADAARTQQQAMQGQLQDQVGDLRAVRSAQSTLDQRTRNLETALGRVSDQQTQGRDALLLDDAEFLLRAGQQRWVLFHDAAAAARAYELADDALAQVGDPVFAPVRSAIADERAALTAASTPARAHALDALSALRAQAALLPLVDTDATRRSVPDNSLPARAWHALSGVLRVERDNGTSVPAVNARIARELLALDFAQAQASLLAFDQSGYRDAMQQADALLAARFDGETPEVRAVRAQVQAISAVAASTAPQLGGALAQLRTLRAAHAMQALSMPSASSAGRP